MEKKSKILTFIASDKYFKVWLALFYVFGICVIVYITSFERTASREAVLATILAFLAPVFFLGNALRNRIIKKHETYEEDIEYIEDIEEDIEEVEKEAKSEDKKKGNLRRKIGIYIACLVAIQVVFALIYSLGIDESIAQNLWIVVLFSGIFIYNYKKHFNKKK